MLKILRRKNISKIVFWFLVILILPAFVFWGTGSLSGSKEKRPKSVGTLHKKDVSFDDFYRSLGGIRCQMVLGYFNQPRALDALLANKELMGKLAWDRLIMLREADLKKMKASDKEVVGYITSHPIFTRGSAFDENVYNRVLRYNIGLDPRGFEEIVRENIRLKKLNGEITKTVKASDEDILIEYKKQSDKFKISYTLINPEAFMKNAVIGDNEAKDYYEKNKNEFLLPKKSDNAKEADSYANFEDIKESVKSFLVEKEARNLALKSAIALRKDIAEAMRKGDIKFEAAAEKVGAKVSESPFFCKTDYLEGLGEAMPVVEEASRLDKDEVSSPVEIRRGVIIFRVSDTQKFEEERFKKEKDEFAKKVLEAKKNKFLEAWLANAEKETSHIDLKDYEKYYR